MRSKNIRKQKESDRRVAIRQDRDEDTKESDLKTLDTSKARSRPLSVDSRKVLREEARSKDPTPGLSDFVRNKSENSPQLAKLPKDPEKARIYAHDELRATPKPNAYWETTQ